MGESGWTSATLDSLPTLGEELPPWKPVRHSLGLEAFGVNAWLARGAGDQAIDDHDELEDDGSGQEELYFVASGRARFTIDGDELDAPAGTLVAITDPALRRVAVAEEDGTVLLAVGGYRGRAFKPSDWELRALEKLPG
jgi:hypothetical protein